MLPDSTDTLEDEDIGERMVNNENGPYSPGLENLEAEAGKFSLYPNPSSGNFIVECAVSGVLTVFAADGRVVAEYKVGEGKTGLQLPQGISPGLYLTRYKPGNGGIPINKQLIYKP